MNDHDSGDHEAEFYGPWRVTNHKKAITVQDIITVIWDDNGNPMCYAEDDYFMREAVKRINAYPALVRELQSAIVWIEQLEVAILDPSAPTKDELLSQLRAVLR